MTEVKGDRIFHLTCNTEVETFHHTDDGFKREYTEYWCPECHCFCARTRLVSVPNA